MISNVQYEPQVNNNQKKQPNRLGIGSKKVSKYNTADKFLSSDPMLNIKKALKDGSLEYTDATKFLGITLRDAFYCYTPQKGETIADIKKKFGIKDGVIKALNGISDEEYCPAQHNKQIYFRLSE